MTRPSLYEKSVRVLLRVSSHTHTCSTSFAIRGRYMCVSFDPIHPKHSLLFYNCYAATLTGKLGRNRVLVQEGLPHG